MITQNFTISVTNIGHEVQRVIAPPVGSPVSVERPASSSRSAGDVSIVVTLPDGTDREIPVSDERVEACLRADDPRAATQAYVDELLVAIRGRTGDAPRA